jgi:hypothetical protein
MTEEDLSRPLTESVFIFRVRWMFMVSAISLVVLLFSTSHDPRSELREPGRSAGQG